MRVSINWLKKFVDIEGIKLDEILDRVIKAGFEIDEIEYMASGTNLVVGEVVECENHPDSDHLHVTKVNIGNEVLDIVCGAPNCRKGLKVIVAKVGAKLPEVEIKASKIRGVDSYGMLCSLLELGVKKEYLPENSPSLNGIEELDDNFKVGDEDIIAKLGYDDVIIDLATYANRPDTISVYGIFKEIAAILNRPCSLIDYPDVSDLGKESGFKVTSSSKNCPHFLAKVVNSVKIGPSPEWLVKDLQVYGIKAINNLVDISNFVMLQTGQPLHFYDLRSNPNRNIEVRDDYEGDYTALDGETYKIEKGDLMIMSDNQPIGIAGIMGGDNTKILDDTTSLIIEAALFDYAQIRRTANRLGLQTEAAMRFAKGLDPLAQSKAMNMAVEMLKTFAQASDFEKSVEYGKEAYVPYTVSETLSHLNALIGKEYKLDEVVDVLKRLNLNPEVKGDEIISHIPSYRANDLKIREDIDEEIVRLTNFDDLKSTLPSTGATYGKLTPSQLLRRRVEEVLVNNSLNEAVSYTLVNDEFVNESLMPNGETIELISPLSDARKYIRTSLMNSLIESLVYNLDHFQNNVNLFEISKIYSQGKVEERLGIIMYGNLEEAKPIHLQKKADFYLMKSIAMELFNYLGFDKSRISIDTNQLDTNHFHPYQSCCLNIDKKCLGLMGKLHPSFVSKHKLKDVYYLEISLDKLQELTPAKVKAVQVNKYPSISRDISIVLKEEVSSDELLKLVKKAGGSLVKNVEVFDIYRGEHIEKGFKSVSISIIFEDFNKTLKIDDIEQPYQKILDTLNKQYQANLR